MAETSVKREREDVDPKLLGSLHEKPSEARKVKTEEKGQRWTPEQDDALRQAVEKYGQRNWKAIAAEVEGRNHAQCLQRWNKVLKPGLVKGHWSYEEDSILERMVLQGCHSWAEVSAHIPGRTAKQCRERWRNHLDPSINKAPFTPEEDLTIQQAYKELNNRWTQIAELLPGRTEDAVKMRWKALNPNQKSTARPGRPTNVTGGPNAKTRTPNTDMEPPIMVSVPHASHNTPGAPHVPMYVYSGQYDPSSAIAMPMGSMPLQHQTPHPGHVQPHGHMATPHHAGYAGATSELPEPSVEPLGDEHNADVDSKDAAILKELLRSQSNSLLSFGSSRGLNSFADMSPDELLASGELDEMLKAVSLANEGGGGATASGKSSFRLSGSYSNSRSLNKALESMGSQDKHIFQELIDELRVGGPSQPSGQPSDPNDPNLYSFTSTSGRNLLHSLEFDDRRNLTSGKLAPPSAQPAAGAHEEDEDDFSDLMKPIHSRKRGF